MSVPGLSEAKLDQLHEVLSGHVEAGTMPGLIALVGRGGQAHVDVIGTPAFGSSEPLGRDAIFRIASLSKPLMAVAAMTLVDDGTLRLDDPVDAWLPELADRRVLRTLESTLDDTVAAEGPITVEHLLSFRMGFGAVMAMPGSYPIQVAEEALALRTLGPPWPPPPLTSDQWMAALGTLPLIDQPGRRWMYNTGAQVLGVLVERVCGLPLQQALAARLFDPLGMVDTDFSVVPADLGRFTTAYSPDPETGRMDVLDDVADSWWATPPAMPNAAGWMVSTIDDFWSFARMMAAGGARDGGRILSPEAFDLMITDRLDPDDRRANAIFLGDHSGWGLGLAVPAGDGSRGVPGGFGWDGGTGTTWRTDPDLDLTCILFTQRAMTSPQPPQVFDDFFAGAYAAVED